jgi:RND family efflux transporter MFP subunit
MKLAFKTGGVVDRIFVDEGDRVEAGQTLAQLDLDEIDAQVDLAQSAFEKSERDLDRMRALYADSIVSLEQLQNVETALTAARSNLTMAQFNRRHSEIIAPSDGRIQRRHADPSELVSGGQKILELGESDNWVIRLGLPDRDVVKIGLGDDATVHFDAYPDETFDGRVTEIAEAADPASGTFEVEVALIDSPPKLKSGFIASVDLIPSDRTSHTMIPV